MIEFRDDNKEELKRRLQMAFHASHISRPSKIVANRHNPESEELTGLIEKKEWDNLPNDFLCDHTIWIIMTQDGIDYFLPGILLACLQEDREAKDAAVHMLNEMCVTRSVSEWSLTISKYSIEQTSVFIDIISYIRMHDPEFWINTSFDQAVAAARKI